MDIALLEEHIFDRVNSVHCHFNLYFVGNKISFRQDIKNPYVYPKNSPLFKTRSIIMLHILFRENFAKNGLLTQISHQKLR